MRKPVTLIGGQFQSRHFGTLPYLVSLPWPAMRQQDIACLLADAHSIFVSGGFHCAHVLHHRLQLDGTLRASAHIYNDAGDVDAFIRALHDL